MGAVEFGTRVVFKKENGQEEYVAKNGNSASA